jgi:hypothetical protein
MGLLNSFSRDVRRLVGKRTYYSFCEPLLTSSPRSPRKSSSNEKVGRLAATSPGCSGEATSVGYDETCVPRSKQERMESNSLSSSRGSPNLKGIVLRILCPCPNLLHVPAF